MKYYLIQNTFIIHKYGLHDMRRDEVTTQLHTWQREEMTHIIIKLSVRQNEKDVIIDHKLNWIQHISYVKSKMSKGIGIMDKARQFLTKKALLMLYHAYIFPYMTYCIEV